MINARRSLLALLSTILLLSVAFSQEATPNSPEARPDTAIAGVELGDRASAKALLEAYQPTFGDEGEPEYYFYNEFADQVIRFTAKSWEDRHLITAIEVYAVTDKYRSPHFQLKEIGYFKTTNELFIGYKQSAMSLLSAFTIGVQDPKGKNRVREGKVQKLFGEPDETVEEGGYVALIYKKSGMKTVDLDGPLNYRASYSFRKGKLKRMSISIKPVE
ncbi:MAG: hypothetical protein IPM63_10925 [Acidobacteriota bacterium]|nr:MAG: hypothetical protein IPM63_10925 [Acidobacteriota bacterium]